MESSLSFKDIAEFLSIDEDMVRSLADRNLLPGNPTASGREVTREAIESWYVKISGIEWAKMVSDGQVRPITVEIELPPRTTEKAVEAVLDHWQQTQKVEFLGVEVGVSGVAIPRIRLREPQTDLGASLNEIQDTTSGVPDAVASIRDSVRRDIMLTYEVENLVREQALDVFLTPEGYLRLTIVDELADLPQREREMSRIFLARSARRLAQEIGDRAIG